MDGRMQDIFFTGPREAVTAQCKVYSTHCYQGDKLWKSDITVSLLGCQSTQK